MIVGGGDSLGALEPHPGRGPVAENGVGAAALIRGPDLVVHVAGIATSIRGRVEQGRCLRAIAVPEPAVRQVVGGDAGVRGRGGLRRQRALELVDRLAVAAAPVAGQAALDIVAGGQGFQAASLAARNSAS